MTRFPSCIMGTCVIPWSQQYDFQEDLFRHQVSELLRVGTKHLYLFGTAGEGYAVTNRQFREITRVFVEEMQRGEAEPMVGLISLSLPTIIERIEIARDLGVRQFQISLPGRGALRNAEVDLFFRRRAAVFRMLNSCITTCCVRNGSSRPKNTDAWRIVMPISLPPRTAPIPLSAFKG